MQREQLIEASHKAVTGSMAGILIELCEVDRTAKEECQNALRK